MKSVSKIKIILGYVLLLGAMLFSLFFVHREMEHLMRSDGSDMQWTDSLMELLKEKDANTIRMLRTLSEARDSVISTRDIEQIIAHQDSAVTQKWVQKRVVAHRDTVVTRPTKKGFFRRLGEVFAPPKKDTAIQVKSYLEYEADTLIAPYNPVDSLQEKLRAVAQQRRENSTVIRRRNRNLQRLDQLLTARIDTLLRNHEEEVLLQARQEAQHQQEVRQRSAQIIARIAIGAVLLAVCFLLIIGRDIARSNRYRRELEQARQHAEELLATRERLMLAITHDFKAPLGSIIGYADLLARLTVDERQLFYLDNLKTSSEHLLKLVVDLLDFHRLDLHKAEIHRVSFYPARLLEEVCVSFEPLAANKQLELKRSIAPQLEGTYICDPLRLRQILNNLLSNAVKFTDRGSITLDARYEARCLVVDLTDTGKGMNPAEGERIFQAFTRLPGAQGKEGFGLGLSIVHGLVQLLEGTIEVDSQPGRGSTFSLRIPLFPVTLGTPSSAEASTPTSASLSTANLATPPNPYKRLLLIDDDRIQLTLTTAMLAQSGIEAVACIEVDALLEALRREPFDALLTDVQMPAMSGFDLFELLRASNIAQARTIPIIAVTARSEMQPEAFLAVGFAGALHKPFTVAELMNLTSTAPAASAAPPIAPTRGYGFGALTAFSEDDAEAARTILESFVAQTRLNLVALQQALAAGDGRKIAALSHQMLPLFTLVGASELVAILKELEQLTDKDPRAEEKEKTLRAMELIEDVVGEAAVAMSSKNASAPR